MDQTVVLSLTEKGSDEVLHRTCKLGIKLRSVLLLLNRPQTVQFTLQKSVFPKDEILAAIDTLLNDGFIVQKAGQPEDLAIKEAEAPRPAVAATAAAAPTGITKPATAPLPKAPGAQSAQAPSSEFGLSDEIILSEAKFLLIDFCVDCFGMQSEKLTEDIRSCRSSAALNLVLKEIVAMTGKHKPDQINALKEAIRKANETA